MNRYPAADWQPVPYTALGTRRPFKAALLHTNGGGWDLLGWWKQQAKVGHIGAQYQILNSGRVICYVDPDLVVYHAYGASEWSIGIETEDDGSNHNPWTPEQIESIARVLVFHKVPPQMLTGPGPADGVGFHQQQDVWNRNHHDCPGTVRRAQIPQVLARMAALYASPQEDDMTPDQDARLQRVEQTLADIQSFLLWAFHPRADVPGKAPDFTRPAFETSGELAKALLGRPVPQLDPKAVAAAIAPLLGQASAAAVADNLEITVKR